MNAKKSKVPHVISPNEHDSVRTVKLNRNFNDIFAALNEMQKNFDDMKALLTDAQKDISDLRK